MPTPSDARNPRTRRKPLGINGPGRPSRQKGRVAGADLIPAGLRRKSAPPSRREWAAVRVRRIQVLFFRPRDQNGAVAARKHGAVGFPDSGWLDFRIADMVQTAGRPISTALRLLLREPRLLSLLRAQRLAALLEDSRKFQNEVSERLAEQVLHALYELLRGFQAAHDASKGELCASRSSSTLTRLA